MYPCTVPNNDKFPINDIKFEIEDIALFIQRIRWDDEKISKQLRTGFVNYEFDQYVHRANALPSG